MERTLREMLELLTVEQQPPQALKTVWMTGLAAFSCFIRSFACAPPLSSLM